MRIALVSYEFPPATTGGIGTYAWHAARALVGIGHEVVVFSAQSRDESTPVKQDVAIPGLNVLRSPCDDRRIFHRIAIPALVAEHRRKPFDAAEVPDLYAEGAGLREALPDLPIVLRCHTPCYIPREIDFNALPPAGRFLSALRVGLGGICRLQNPLRILRLMGSRLRYGSNYRFDTDPERLVAVEADLVAPPSHRLASRLRDDWMLPDEKIIVLPYAHIPDPALLSLPLPAQAGVVSFHGKIRYFKGVHVLFDAMALLMAKRPDLRLLLAGSIDESPVADLSWRAWLDDHLVTWRNTMEWIRPRLARWSARVEYAGFVPPWQLSAHLARADVCVFPSLFDNFPSACLEAMSAGRAIVATRSGGMEEMLGDDEAGLLVPPGDAPALAAAIARLLDDAPLRLRLAENARARLLTFCDPAAIAARHATLFTRASTIRAARRQDN
jgi:glycosyltransferase involved in cell wall biosynthesis